MKGVSKAKRNKCAKCGSSPADDPNVKFHRFPQPNKVNKPRCELWAKFCFPNNAWKSPKFQSKLYREHRLLCDKHFKSTAIEKEKMLRRSSRLEQNNDKIQEKFADVEIVEIKNEPDEDIIDIDHSLETSSLKQTKIKENLATKKHSTALLMKKTNSKPLKEKAEIQDSVETNMKDIWDVELPEMSHENFDDVYNKWFSKTSKYDLNDDCQLYGKLIIKKLRTYSSYERNLIMYKIDGLLIENPPGFDKSSDSTTTELSNPPPSVVNKPSKSKRSLKKTTDFEKSSPKFKRKRATKEALQEVEMTTVNEEPHIITTQVSSTSTCLSPVVALDILSPALTNSIPKQPVTITHIPSEPVKVTSYPTKKSVMKYQPVKVTSSIQNQPVKSSIPNKPVKVTTISNEPLLKPLHTSVPSHLPLQITIPETKFVPVSQSKVSQPKGKIVIMKSKSTKYVPSSQPPILITVPSLPNAGNFPISTQSDMNSLEQLSSIAVTRASQAQYHTSLETEEIEADDMNVVSHEVILSASSNSPSQNIVETALKNADIDDEYTYITHG